MGSSWYDGMDPTFATRLQTMIEASGGKLGVGSGYRSVEEQTQLWNDALAKYGSEDAARQWVAPPGSSNHNFGIAADLSFDGDGEQWARDNAERFGLTFPMSWEPWHIEPIGARDGTYKSQAPDTPTGTAPGTQDAYTTPPTGQTSPVDATQRFELGYQLASLNDLMMAPAVGEVSNPNAAQATGAAPTNTLTKG